MTFKPGDVVTYTLRRTRVGVVVRLEKDRVWARFRDANTPGAWNDRDTWASPEALSLHPDPDPIFTDFAAWRLTNGDR